jgi:hypothetical protein
VPPAISQLLKYGEGVYHIRKFESPWRSDLLTADLASMDSRGAGQLVFLGVLWVQVVYGKKGLASCEYNIRGYAFDPKDYGVHGMWVILTYPPPKK